MRVNLQSTLLALMALIVNTQPLAAQEQPRVISTSGEAIVYVVPDEVIVTLGIETFNPNLAEAKASNDASSKLLLAAIGTVGVEEKHIQTDTLQIEIRYRSSHPSEGIEGYFARRTYSVTLKDVKKLEALVDAALTNGANQLMGIQYRTTELRKHRDEARKLAIRAAKEKAVALASELECKVGPPRTINEGSAGYYGWGRGNYNVMAQNTVQFEPGNAGAGGETTPMGQMGVHASVSVTFDLESKEEGGKDEIEG